MPRKNEIPAAFLAAPTPVTTATALRAGVTADDLRGPQWQRVAHGYHAPAGVARDTRADRLHVILDELDDAVVGGISAVQLWLREPARPEDPLFVIVPRGCSPARRPWLRALRSRVPAKDRIRIGDVPLTTPLRTAFDCARLLPVTDAVAEVDALLNARLVTRDQLAAYIASHPRLRGVRQARLVLELCDERAESRMESRLRVLLVLAGLPRPEVNVELRDAEGQFLARVDLYWPQARLVLEYHGDHHRDRAQYRADLARRDALERAGYRVRHATARDVYAEIWRLVALLRRDLGLLAA